MEKLKAFAAVDVKAGWKETQKVHEWVQARVVRLVFLMVENWDFELDVKMVVLKVGKREPAQMVGQMAVQKARIVVVEKDIK